MQNGPYIICVPQADKVAADIERLVAEGFAIVRSREDNTVELEITEKAMAEYREAFLLSARGTLARDLGELLLPQGLGEDSGRS